MPEQATDRRGIDPLERAMGWIELLSSEVGPRRPTTRGERLAALLMREELSRLGVSTELERFRGYSTFGQPFGILQALALAPSLLPARLRAARVLLAAAAAAGLISEGGLVHTPLSRLLSRAESGNLVGTIEPSGDVRRTLCLSAHLDTSRSGLLFDPRFVGHLGHWISAQSLAILAAGAAEPILGGRPSGRRALAGLRATIAAGLLLLLEREVRGEDVPGANDNASGCAVVASLAAELAANRLEHTRVVVLMTGCEEAGTLGTQAFLRERDADGWLFVNFDNVGGDGSVRFLRREGVLTKFSADPGLIAVASEVAERRPDLQMAPEDSPAGLTYDTSPILARGGRALTISVQDGRIPNLHWPTDTLENVDPDGLRRTIEAGRELVVAIDSGAAD
jgi:hypothetical protein